VLARRLGLDIYEIDLSQVVSKWLGETEKNLSDVFDAAEPGHVVLLFNEADSLFGKRTSDVKSSNDRYANLETNYLLQRLERFNGLAILTTNLTSAIDQAFKRRFSYDVFFGFPGPEMRAELWRRTLSARSASDIDFDALSEKYELSGGFIKVACERAAYVAGGAGTEITETVLRRTIERMYRERGKLSAVGPLE
jgi:SpoVK/Ycf46/Vps4 family AAA+-type ATPase